MSPFAKGFSVKLHGRAGLTYREGDKELKVDSEMLFGDYDMVIYWSQVKAWSPPFADEPLTEAEKARIKANIETDLKRLRLDWA